MNPLEHYSVYHYDIFGIEEIAVQKSERTSKMSYVFRTEGRQGGEKQLRSKDIFAENRRQEGIDRGSLEELAQAVFEDTAEQYVTEHLGKKPVQKIEGYKHGFAISIMFKVPHDGMVYYNVSDNVQENTFMLTTEEQKVFMDYVHQKILTGKEFIEDGMKQTSGDETVK